MKEDEEESKVEQILYKPKEAMTKLLFSEKRGI